MGDLPIRHSKAADLMRPEPAFVKLDGRRPVVHDQECRDRTESVGNEFCAFVHTNTSDPTTSYGHQDPWLPCLPKLGEGVFYARDQRGHKRYRAYGMPNIRPQEDQSLKEESSNCSSICPRSATGYPGCRPQFASDLSADRSGSKGPGPTSSPPANESRGCSRRRSASAFAWFASAAR